MSKSRDEGEFRLRNSKSSSRRLERLLLHLLRGFLFICSATDSRGTPPLRFIRAPCKSTPARLRPFIRSASKSTPARQMNLLLRAEQIFIRAPCESSSARRVNQLRRGFARSSICRLFLSRGVAESSSVRRVNQLRRGSACSVSFIINQLRRGSVRSFAFCVSRLRRRRFCSFAGEFAYANSKSSSRRLE